MDEEISVLMCIAGAFVGLIFGLAVGSCNKQNEFQNRAVAHKAGEYVYDKDGSSNFRWNDEAK